MSQNNSFQQLQDQNNNSSAQQSQVNHGPTSHPSYNKLVTSLSESCEAFRCISLEPSFDAARTLYDSLFKLHESAVNIQRSGVDIQIPLDLLDCIDRGRDPMEWLDALLKERENSTRDNNAKRGLVTEMRESLQSGLEALEKEYEQGDENDSMQTS